MTKRCAPLFDRRLRHCAGTAIYRRSFAWGSPCQSSRPTTSYRRIGSRTGGKSAPKNLFGVTIELEPEKRADFRGTFSAQAVGGATLVEIHASPYRVTRSVADIAQAPSDSLCIYQQIDGGCWFDNDRGSEFTLRAGDIAISNADLPYKTTPIDDRGFHLRLLKIPLASIKVSSSDSVALPAQLLTVKPGFSSLVADSVNSFFDQAPHLSGTAADSVVQTLAQFAMMARGLAEPSGERSRRAVRAGRLQLARDIVDRDLHQSDLSPGDMAARLGVSVRHLQMLFEPTGTSYARYVLGRRLERARELLLQSPDAAVADVAQACGFQSLATFYRAFRIAFGMSPGEYRDGAMKSGNG